MMKYDINSVTKLNNGVEMPCFGLGAYKSEPGAETKNSVIWALELGYKLIDTAAFYRNEKDVGDGVREAGKAREDVFITTKIWPTDFNDVGGALDKSLKLLGTGYIDLYLMHWPGTDEALRLKVFEQMLKFAEQGKIRACGVSNFYIDHLESIEKNTGVIPANNQIEAHPWRQRRELREYCAGKGISVTAWGPIFHGHLNEEPLVAEIGKSYGKSAAQVTLRWHLQHGINIIPKSVKKERLRENADIFDFELSSGDMDRIDALDGKGGFAFDSNIFNGDVEEYRNKVKK